MPPSSNDFTTRSATRSRKEYILGTPGRPPVLCTVGCTSPTWSQYLSCRGVQPVRRHAWCDVKPSTRPPDPRSLNARSVEVLAQCFGDHGTLCPSSPCGRVRGEGEECFSARASSPQVPRPRPTEKCRKEAQVALSGRPRNRSASRASHP